MRELIAKMLFKFIHRYLELSIEKNNKGGYHIAMYAFGKIVACKNIYEPELVAELRKEIMKEPRPSVRGHSAPPPPPLRSANIVMASHGGYNSGY